MGMKSYAKESNLPLYKGEDQTNSVWGSWKVIGFGKYDTSNYNHKWKCLCLKCNKEYLVTNSTITLGRSKGCLNCTGLKGKDNPNWKGTKDVTGAYFCSIRNGARTRNLSFEVTIEDLQRKMELQHYKCVLSGTVLTNNNRSLDRIDSTKGYSKDNIQWVTKDINKMKNNIAQESFISLCVSVAAHHE